MDGVLQPVAFPPFCPVGLAGIRELPATLEDRAVPVDLARFLDGKPLKEVVDRTVGY